MTEKTDRTVEVTIKAKTATVYGIDVTQGTKVKVTPADAEWMKKHGVIN